MTRRAIDITLIVIGLAAMVWMDRHRPNLTMNQAPFVTRGRIGETVRASDFALTVDRIELARALALEPGLGGTQVRRETNGVFVIVHARVEGLQEPIQLPDSTGAPSLRTREGVVYLHAGGRLPFGYPLLTSGMAAAPEMPVRGMLLFELPPERLAGAVLIAARRMLPDLDSTIEIDLGLTADDVQRQLASMPDSASLQKGTASW